MVFFVLERKDEVPVLNFCPPRSRSWLKGGGPYVGPVWEHSSNTQPGSFCQSLVWLKRQISAGRILRARFPDPAQSLSLRGQGTWDPASSQAFHLRWRGSEAFTAYDPWRLLPPSGCRGEDWGEIHCCFKAWSSQLVAVVRALELCRTQPLTCLSAFLAGPKGLGEGCNSPLPAVSIPESLLADCWWNGSSNHHVLSLAC